MSETPILRVSKISKKFPGVLALNEVDFELLPNEVHILMGENGAGKSTLLKILSGVYQADSGTIFIDGEQAKISNPHASQVLGISIIYQEFSLVHEMTVAENIFLGREKIKYPFLNVIAKKQMYEESKKLLRKINCQINPNAKVRDLGIGQQQMVEIARALGVNANIIIMDEPTSSLSHYEIQELFEIIEQLKSDGKSIIYVSHRLEEVEKIGDRATVLRDGKKIGTVNISETNSQNLIKMMVGRQVDMEYPWSQRKIGDVVLSANGIARRGIFNNVSFKLHKGEILGIFGIVGSGRTEMIQSLFGYLPYDQGVVEVMGKQCKKNNRPLKMINMGIGLIPEDRMAHGLIGVSSFAHNITLSSLFRFIKGIHLNLKKEKKIALEFKRKFKIQTPTIDTKIIYLSGGNQQKVCLSKWLCSDSDILIFDEPTKGIDIQTKYEIHSLISSLAKDGKAIIMISSEIKEILGMSDTILVMRQGEIMGIFDRKEANDEVILTKAIVANSTATC